MSIGLETTAGDLGRIDVAGFREGVDRIRAEAHAAIGAADYGHLRRIEWYGRVATGLGYATAWGSPIRSAPSC